MTQPPPQPTGPDDPVVAAYELNRVSVRKVLDRWAEQVDLDPTLLQVTRRGVWQHTDPPRVTGWVRFCVDAAQFVAEFDLALRTSVWLEAPDVDGGVTKLGPIADWKGLQVVAEEADRLLAAAPAGT